MAEQRDPSAMPDESLFPPAAREAGENVPDLYRLAFIPGCFRCPQCEFQWSISTISMANGQIGTTEENRQTPDCPNDGTRMVNVTYKEALDSYAERLKSEFDERDLRIAEIERLESENARLREALEKMRIRYCACGPVQRATGQHVCTACELAALNTGTAKPEDAAGKTCGEKE